MALRRPLSLLLAFALLSPVFAFAHAGAARVTVRVAGETWAQNERLALGDIAEVSGADAEIVARLRVVSLGYAPNVGAVRELTRDRIALAITAAGFDGDTIRLETPPVAIVRRAAQKISEEVLRAAVERVTLAELRGSGITARLVRLDLPAMIEIPSGVVEARATIGGVRNLFTPFNVSIELLVDGRTVRRLSTTAQVEAHAPVLVAARDLAERARLREADVRVEVRKLENTAMLYVRDFETLRGAALARTLAAGEPFTTDALYEEIVVKPGDAVRIVGESGALSLAVAGEARGAGRIGERIQVKNLQSGALLQAFVLDEGLVRVRF